MFLRILPLKTATNRHELHPVGCNFRSPRTAKEEVILAKREERILRCTGSEIREEAEHQFRGLEDHSTPPKTSQLASMIGPCQRPKVEGRGDRA